MVVASLTTLPDADHSGLLIGAAIPETIGKIPEIVLVDWRLEVREIVEAIGMSHSSCFDLKLSLGYEKATRKMAAAFAQE